MPQNNSTSSSFLQRLSTSTSSRSSFMSPKDVRCNIHLLHDSDIIGNEFPRTQSAQTVLDYVCELKRIQEKDFLGLRYQDHNKHRYWLDLSRSIGHVVKHFRKEIKRVGKTDTMTLHLRFRYYPSDPARLSDPNLRYQLFVQLQRDLLHGRLYCPATSAAELAALILQAQLGDYDETKHVGNYVSEYKLLLKQTPKLEERIASIHKELQGKSSVDAELEFLEKASQLDTYAFDPHTIKDPLDPANPVYLGASCKGILIYANQSRTHHIDWNELAKVDYSGRELKLTLSDSYRGGSTTPTNGTNGTLPTSLPNGQVDKVGAAAKQQSKKPLTLKYQCPSGPFAKHLWIHILSQQAFFNELSAQNVKMKFSKPRIPLLSRGSTFRFPSKRVYREIEEEDARLQFDRSTIMDTSIVQNDTTVNSTSADENDDSVLNVSSHSVPTVSSSTTASVVQRYELPRQTPRTEQPWLSKPKNNHVNSFSDNATSTFSTASTPIDESYNNNLRKITNLNISLDNSSTPSSSSPVDIQEPPKIIRTFEHAEQNSTSFTVHLIKREEIVTPTTPTTSSCHQETRAEHLEHKFNKLVENDVDIGRPLASSTPRANKQTPNLEKIENGTVGNGQGVVEKKTSNGHAIQRTEEVQDSLISDKSEISPKTSFVSKAANTLFVLFLMLLLTLALIIVLFEKSEGSHRDFIESNRHLSDLRHHYYEPSRHYVVAQYHKYFGAKL